MLNCSLEPVISEEDAQLETDIPTVQIMDLEQITVGTHEPHPIFPSKALKLKQVDNHNIFVQRIQTNCSKLEDPTLNFDLELHENDINAY